MASPLNINPIMPNTIKPRWTSVKDALPPQDEEVIILTDDVNGTSIPGANRIAFGHIVDKAYAKDYDGWNVPGVHHWMPCPGLPDDPDCAPEEESLQQGPVNGAFEERITQFWNDNVLDMRLDRISMYEMVMRAAKLGASLQREADEKQHDIISYEERQKKTCDACASHKDYCGYISRGLESKCPYLSDVMDGWEMGMKDALAGAIPAKVANVENGKATILADLPEGVSLQSEIKILIIKDPHND